MLHWKEGTLTAKAYDYRPFGDSLAATGELPNQGFANMEQDEESEYIQMGARTYNPALGRFMSVDPLFEAFPGQSAYSYAFNSPLSWSDPSGMAPEKEKKRDRVLTILLNPVYQGEELLFYASIDELGGYFRSLMTTRKEEWEAQGVDFSGGVSSGNGSGGTREGEGTNGSGNVAENGQGGTRDNQNINDDNNEDTESNWTWNGKNYKSKAELIDATKNPPPDQIPDDNIPAFRADNVTVYANDITQVFNEHLSNIEQYFMFLNYEKMMFGPIFSLTHFGGIQYFGRNSNFLNLKQTETYKEGGRYYGKYLSGPDCGNYAYGVATNAAGIDLPTALMGAGAFGLINGSRKNVFNIFCLFDEFQDSKMIIRGYFRIH